MEVDAVARVMKMSETEIQGIWKAHDFIARLFAGRYRGSGRPFVSHLAGTAGLALMHHFEYKAVLAAYAHAAYMQGEFGTTESGASPINRERLRGIIGDEAEALVHAYQGYDWLSVLGAFQNGETPSLNEQDRTLLALRVLNELDDSFDCHVYGRKRHEQCISRLEAGLVAIRSMGMQDMAHFLSEEITQVRGVDVVADSSSRRKGSETLIPSGYAVRPNLKIKRELARLLRNH